MDANANPFAESGTGRDPTPSPAAVADDVERPVSPTDRTASSSLGQQESSSPHREARDTTLRPPSARSVSPTDRTPSNAISEQETITPSQDPENRTSRSRTPSPSKRPSKALSRQETAAQIDDEDQSGRIHSKTLDKHPTTASHLEQHPHLQEVYTQVHEAKETIKRKFHLGSVHASGPSARLNPTNVRVNIKWTGDRNDERREGGIQDEKTLLWRARDNRKRRYSTVVPIIPQEKPLAKRLWAQAKETAGILWRMFFTFPYWDMAFWSGWAYTWGSVLFVMDGAWAFMEVASPGSVDESVATYGGPLCFFIGALLYQIGATVAYLEAVNDGSFRGSAMRRFLEGHEDDSRKLLNDRFHRFLSHFGTHHDDEEEEARGRPSVPRRGGVDMGQAERQQSTSGYTSWRWFPTWHALRHHHVYEIGYVACAVQLFGATLYGICGVVNLPGILSSLHPWQKEAAYWIPQIVASCCFLSAGIMFILETQDKWHKPEPLTIGWWIGLWATIGSVGFLLIAIFGAMEFDYDWGEYQASLTSIWGAAAYLISGFLQWYEATDKRERNAMLDDDEEHEPMWSYPMASNARRGTMA